MPNNYEEKNSIELLFDEIEKALNAELYLIALMTALTIPDVMSKIEYGNGGGSNYAKWIDEYVIDMFGRKYGDRVTKREVKNYKNGKLLDKTDNERYLETPTEVCGDNCYQLRCSLLHDVKNVIHGSEKLGKNRKYVWIDECVLQFTKEEFTKGIMNGYDTYLKELPDGEIVTLAEKFCYINVKELCNDIIRGAKNYINDKEVKAKMPMIKVNNGGGKMPSCFDPERSNNNLRLVKKLYHRYVKLMENQHIN